MCKREMVKCHAFIWAICFTSCGVFGQELEPRAYANLPKDFNAIGLNYALTNGDVITDPSLAIANFTITAQSLAVGYIHTFNLLGKLARIQCTIPYAFLVGKLQVQGRDTSGNRGGFADSRIKLGINLIGSPALSKKDFIAYSQKFVLGISLVTNVPTGNYYKDKYINIGTNRWGFKPEIGASYQVARIYLEAYTGVWFYTNNDTYQGNNQLHQNPILSFQVHACYYFKNKMWIGADGTWYEGGKISINDQVTADLVQDRRLGATWSVPLRNNQSFKLQFHAGVYVGNQYSYNAVSLTYEYAFY
jgi:hypothetical protein